MATVVTYSKRSFSASFKADPEIWSGFKGDCKLLGVSICSVLEALIVAWREGQKATATVIKPVVINQNFQYTVERPRRKPQIQPCVPDPYLCAEKCATAFKKRFEGGENR